MRASAAILLAVAAAMAVAGDAPAAPKPLEAASTWQLDIDFHDPHPIQVQVPGEDKPRTFWYLLYTVTNHTVDEQTQKAAEQIFVPDFVLYTDTGQVLRTGQKTPAAAVFDTIKKSYNNPLLKDSVAMTGKLLHGDDNAKEGVAIWPAFDPQAGAVDIFIGGLSGETAEVALPKPITVTEKDALGKLKTVVKDTIILSKTLHLHYQIPGEAAARLRAPVILTKKDWVMR